MQINLGQNPYLHPRHLPQIRIYGHIVHCERPVKLLEKHLHWYVHWYVQLHCLFTHANWLGSKSTPSSTSLAQICIYGHVVHCERPIKLLEKHLHWYVQLGCLFTHANQLGSKSTPSSMSLAQIRIHGHIVHCERPIKLLEMIPTMICALVCAIGLPLYPCKLTWLKVIRIRKLWSYLFTWIATTVPFFCILLPW